jgi:murein DD-endopeptidase MepM/ murein hydrolase activator NlpD
MTNKKWIHPIKFTGNYPNKWAGYTFLQWSKHSWNWHEGVDYNFGYGSNDLGLPVVAVSDGVIDWQGYHKGWGNHVFIKHEHPIHGTIYSHYAHLKNMKRRIGEKVKMGDQIGECGATGWSNMSPHLHFEIRKPIGKGYDFYPSPLKGWTKTKTKQFYTDPYYFIEADSVISW